MVTLLGRTLTPDEQSLLAQVQTGLAHPGTASPYLWRELRLSEPGSYFAVIMSLIQVPPSSPEERALCDYLISIPEFLPFLADPAAFPRDTLVTIGRAMLQVDPRFDAKLADVLFTREEPATPVLLHVLGALDEISPGGRLTFTLARLLRDCSPGVASKVALLMARRVSNPNWVEQQLSSGDARLRANIVESLWGVNTPQVRARLIRAIEDGNNRVVGNALYGLHLMKDQRVHRHLKGMLQHERPSFRATAAWLIGKTGEQRYRASLLRALGDQSSAVRAAARRALAHMPQSDEHNTPPVLSPQDAEGPSQKPIPAPVNEGLSPPLPDHPSDCGMDR